MNFVFYVGKGPLSDHSVNSFEGHFVHVGGTNMVIDDSTDNQPKVARLMTTSFSPPKNDDIESEECAVVFYYYNLGITSDIGQMKLILMYVLFV